MESPVKNLRDALGWNQTQMAAGLDCSYGSVQNYESGKPVSIEVVEKAKRLAAEHSLKLELSGSEWLVRRGVEPTELLISSTKGKIHTSSTGKVDVSEKPAHNRPHGEREQAHVMLDEIFDSGDAGAIEAVCKNLLMFKRVIRSPVASAVPPKKTKR